MATTPRSNNPARDSGRRRLIMDMLKQLASAGQGGDTMLAHINPQEAAMLQRGGGAGTPNPQTGLPQYFGYTPPPSSQEEANLQAQLDAQQPGGQPRSPITPNYGMALRQRQRAANARGQGSSAGITVAPIATAQGLPPLPFENRPRNPRGSTGDITDPTDPGNNTYNPPRGRGAPQTHLMTDTRPEGGRELLAPPDPYGSEFARGEPGGPPLGRGGSAPPFVAGTDGGGFSGDSMIPRIPPGSAFSGRNPLLRAEQAGSTAYTGVPHILTPPPATFPPAPGGGGAPPTVAGGPYGPQQQPDRMGPSQQPGGTFLGEAAPGRNIGAMSPLPGSPQVAGAPPPAQGQGTLGAQFLQGMDPAMVARLLGTGRGDFGPARG